MRLPNVLSQISARFALAGLILAQGAPLGFVVHDFIWNGGIEVGWREHIDMLITTEASTLFYMWAGTSFFFSCFGWLAGQLANRIVEQNEKLEKSFQLLSELDRARQGFLMSVNSTFHSPVVGAIELLRELRDGSLDLSDSEARDLASSVLRDLESLHKGFSGHLLRTDSSESEEQPLLSQGLKDIFPDSSIELSEEECRQINVRQDKLLPLLAQLFKTETEKRRFRIRISNEGFLGGSADQQFAYLIFESLDPETPLALDEWDILVAKNVLVWEHGQIWLDDNGIEAPRLVLALPRATTSSRGVA